ncbi:hypothetical protein [Chryseobacterium pennipullorum]|uniref:Uncharacterized protein n=1 Tax=Chryseobacterium pennipullorum TaxID=2258963 RepID=A0A3D9AYL8_9FLAO|nr:hypothetical protein [Chryseobacterium pennipullorum]REC46411.1 hypothetical protein DRF67_14115 [Chryseobacterium pennipullorum]
MIKFNFNFNANVTSNRDKKDKKGIKIILIVFGLFIFVAISGVIGVGSFIAGTVSSMGKAVEEYNRQQKYVQSLPVLKCAVYTDTTVTAPLSGDNAALYFLQVGKARRISRYSSKIYEDFDYSMAAGYSKGSKLSVNGRLYDIDFTLCIMDSLGGGERHFTEGTFGTTYKAPYYLNNYKPIENQKISALKDKHPWINSFLGPFGLNNILVNEYVFKNGDSVYIKGKIKNNKIVPFVEHAIF